MFDVVSLSERPFKGGLYKVKGLLVEFLAVFEESISLTISSFQVPHMRWFMFQT